MDDCQFRAEMDNERRGFTVVALEPRPYQQEAASWSLARQRAVCCLPTGCGKTLVGLLWAMELLDSGRTRRVLLLEPTRLLVNQTAEYYLDKARAECIPLDGRIPREQRRPLWQAPLVVTTPETAYNDRDLLDFDAVVVDECHHAIGQDAFAKLLAARSFAYCLGLSATVPEKRRTEVEALIGPLRHWSWTDPEIRPYVPDWIGEVYESALGQREAGALTTIRQLPAALGLNPGLLERYLTRDGTPALVETLERTHLNLARAYGPELLPMLAPIRGSPHKATALDEVLAGHDFKKARTAFPRQQHRPQVTQPLHKKAGDAGALHKDDGISQVLALQQARTPDCRLVISTSAGEEGVDLPSADLLIVWGNVASEIRFIQRQGRLMRRTGDRLKFAVFLVTPETADYDSFARGLETAVEKGAVDVGETFGWDPEVLWPRTTWWHVSEALRGKPSPLAEMEETLQVRGNVADRVINHALKRGRLFYVYDVVRIAQDAVALGERWYQEMREAMLDATEESEDSGVLSDGPGLDPEWHRRVGWSIGTSWGGKMREYRVYALCDDVDGLRRSRPDLFSPPQEALCGELILAGRKGKRSRRGAWIAAGEKRRDSVFLLGQWFGYTPGADLSLHMSELQTREDALGLVFRRRKNERLEYWCVPPTPQVLQALAQNFAKFLELLDQHRVG